MNDSGVRRHHLEIIKRLLAPFEKLVAFLVALELHVAIDHNRGFAAIGIHLHRVIDHELDRLQRINFFRIAAKVRHRVSHGGQIHHAGNPGEILQKNSRRGKRDFGGRRRLWIPAR